MYVDNVVVTILNVYRGSIKVGIEASQDTPIHHEKIYRKSKMLSLVKFKIALTVTEKIKKQKNLLVTGLVSK